MAYWDGSRWTDEAGATPTAPRRRRGVRHLTPHAIAIAGLVLAATAGSVFAAKGGKVGSTSTIEVVVMSATRTADGVIAARHGDTVTFEVTTAAGRPYVLLNCYQGDAWVYASQAGWWSGSIMSREFVLAADSWPAGAATCTARLGDLNLDGTRFRELARTTFDVAG